MAKKKTTKKSHPRSARSPLPTTAPTIEGGMAGAMQLPKRPPVPATVTVAGASRNAPALVRDFGYVSRDLRSIGLLGGSLLAIEIVLWYLFGHTALGSSVYNLIKL